MRMNRADAGLAVLATTVLLWLAASPKAPAQAVAMTSLEIGSRGVASVEPPVPRPVSKPCVVTLFAHKAFDDHGNGSSMAARPHRFHFAPPSGCDGIWSKVVLEVDFRVPAGRQFDRTASIWLGGVNLYFGTTMEPEPDLAQHWRIARDLTDYSALFSKPQVGQIILNNWISPTTNQPIYATARLLFYPRAAGRAAPDVADRVYPLSSDAAGEQQIVNTSGDVLSRLLTFPRDIERAYLDVIAQSQAHDERWYTCVDKQYLEETRDYSLEAFEACDGGSFRGVEVMVDGKPAGLAPVYPWVFAGGIAPHLWLPTPGIQTVNFIPFRVDLTPFAGVMDDGKPHSVGVRVLGADHFFNLAANLLVYEEHLGATLHGELLVDTLGSKQPSGLAVKQALHIDAAGRTVGTIDTDLMQSYEISGVLHTPRGTVRTTVRYAQHFSNHQTFNRPGAKQYDETIHQGNAVSMTVNQELNGKLEGRFVFSQNDPFSVDVRKTMVTTGQDFTALVAVQQGHEIEFRRSSSSGHNYHALLDEKLSTHDRAYGKTIPPPLDRSNFDHKGSGKETVRFKDSIGSCYQAEIRSREERLTSVQEGTGCPDHSNHLASDSRPDGPWLMPLHW